MAQRVILIVVDSVYHVQVLLNVMYHQTVFHHNVLRGNVLMLLMGDLMGIIFLESKMEHLLSWFWDFYFWEILCSWEIISSTIQKKLLFYQKIDQKFIKKITFSILILHSNIDSQ